MQRELRKNESEPGDQVLVKVGLNVVLEPPAVWTAVLERLVQAGHIDLRDQNDLQAEHKARRELFLRNVRSWRFLDLCPRQALETFARTGYFHEGSADEPLNLTPSERGQFLEQVATFLDDFPNYELVVVEVLPFEIRCHAKDSRDPVVCIETPPPPSNPSSHPPWAMIREPTFCKSLLTHLRRSYPQSAEDRQAVRGQLLELAGQARSQAGLA